MAIDVPTFPEGKLTSGILLGMNGYAAFYGDVIAVHMEMAEWRIGLPDIPANYNAIEANS